MFSDTNGRRNSKTIASIGAGRIGRNSEGRNETEIAIRVPKHRGWARYDGTEIARELFDIRAGKVWGKIELYIRVS